MGWHQMPKFNSSASFHDHNSFASPKSQTTGRISVKLPPDDWLCQKLEKLNLTLTECYPSPSIDANRLCKDQFVKVPPHTQRWHDVYSERKLLPGNGRGWPEIQSLSVTMQPSLVAV